MAEDWFGDVRKYAPAADPDDVAGIVRYCGIALRKRDSALVAFSSPEETARVRDNFLKKKLALTQSDSELDAAIAAIGEQMKADRTKNRVTVYYLLADRFDKLHLFRKAGAVSAKSPSAPAGGTASASGVSTPASPSPSSGGGLAGATGNIADRPVAAPARLAETPDSPGFNWGRWLLLALVVILIVLIVRYWL